MRCIINKEAFEEDFKGSDAPQIIETAFESCIENLLMGIVDFWNDPEIKDLEEAYKEWALNAKNTKS